MQAVCRPTGRDGGGGELPTGARASLPRAGRGLLHRADVAGRIARRGPPPGRDRRRQSAGGGLAAALAFTARDRAEVDVAAQVLIYPMLDDRSSDRARRLDHGFRMWDRRSNVWAWRSFLGDADPRVAVPARRTDLAGLPPAWIGVGSLDLFHDGDLAYAEHLRAAGVPCRNPHRAGRFPRVRLPGAENAGGPRLPRQSMRHAPADPGGPTVTTELQALREAAAARCSTNGGRRPGCGN